MAILHITKANGATLKPGPMLTVEPAQTVDDQRLSTFAEGTGLNAPFVADLLSMCVTHERDGVQLFSMLAEATLNPMLKAQYERFRADSVRSVEILEELIGTLGGNSLYASPPARLTEGMDTHLVQSFLGAGSGDPLSIDMATVDATLVATTICAANVELLLDLAAEAEEGRAKTAMLVAAEQLGGPVREHLEWARSMRRQMAVTQAKHPMAQKVGQAVEGMVGKVKDALS